MTVYRFFNQQTSAHFYTSSESERAAVQASLPRFTFEGPAFTASGSASEGLSPVFRFFNTQTGVHFYTISEDEKNQIQAQLPQFKLEGVAYYASKVAGPAFKPLYRFFLTARGFHFYTSSANERDRIISTLPQYRYEGIGYHVIDLAGGALNAKVPHTGVPSSMCYEAGYGWAACGSAGPLALNSEQDGHRAHINTMSYSEVPKTGGSTYARTECVKDNVTGLIWEGKESGGPRGGSTVFTNEIDASTKDIHAANNSLGYVDYVNSIELCGYSDWRLPSRSELLGLVDYNGAFPGPMINASWFPNTPAYFVYWTSASSLQTDWIAWVVSFRSGAVVGNSRGSSSDTSVRLVRSAI